MPAIVFPYFVQTPSPVSACINCFQKRLSAKYLYSIILSFHNRIVTNTVMKLCPIGMVRRGAYPRGISESV